MLCLTRSGNVLNGVRIPPQFTASAVNPNNPYINYNNYNPTQIQPGTIIARPADFSNYIGYYESLSFPSR
ncbi:MAG: hypothetical protein QXV17_04995 [Candidatus Micrarchaeaceae archaeon]